MRTRIHALVVAFLLASSCGDVSSRRTTEAPFQPASSSAFLNYFHGYLSVYATETAPNVIGYAHAPRTLYLAVSMKDSAVGDFALGDTDLEHLGRGQASLRVLEHVFMPHLYLVERGTVHVEESPVTGGLPSFRVHVDAHLVDPVDGTRTRFVADFETQAAGLT